jgi:glycosyltransferase involved in cell wall biosynthesis
MSFVVNVMKNDTLKYWRNKLKWKWYQIPFLMSKNLEIESFMSEYSKPVRYDYDGPRFFGVTDKTNNINQTSKVAIVVPIYVNSLKSKNQVERLIKSIQNQQRIANFVFLVDDCSPIEYDTYGYDINRMEQNSGPAKARNFGIKLCREAVADIIAFTDSDVVLPTNWTDAIVNTFIENKFMQAISGKTISFRKTWYDLYHNVNGTLNARRFKNSKQLLYGPTCNFAIETKSMDNLLFSEDFPLAAGEDIEFCFQFLKKGNNIGHGPKMEIYHDFGYIPLKFRKNKNGFIKVFKKYAKGEKILLQKLPEYYYFLNETVEISSKY